LVSQRSVGRSVEATWLPSASLISCKRVRVGGAETAAKTKNRKRKENKRKRKRKGGGGEGESEGGREGGRNRPGGPSRAW
jgi:hypothetical protein